MDGARINKKTPRALVENGVSVYVPCHNLVNPPKAVLFMTGSGGVKPISTGDAAVLLKKVDENADTEKFSALLEVRKRQYSLTNDHALIPFGRNRRLKHSR